MPGKVPRSPDSGARSPPREVTLSTLAVAPAHGEAPGGKEGPLLTRLWGGATLSFRVTPDTLTVAPAHGEAPRASRPARHPGLWGGALPSGRTLNTTPWPLPTVRIESRRHTRTDTCTRTNNSNSALHPVIVMRNYAPTPGRMARPPGCTLGRVRSLCGPVRASGFFLLVGGRISQRDTRLHYATHDSWEKTRPARQPLHDGGSSERARPPS